mgnify:CR=1 FL=1
MILLLDQVKTFFCMLVFGFFSGLIFNLYQVIIHHLKLKRVLVHISDIIFSIVLGVSGFLLLIYINNGNLRFYVILAIVIGFGLYYSISNFIHKTKIG